MRGSVHEHSLLIATGCSTTFNSVNNVYTGPDQTLSSVPAIVQQDATVVGKAYGDPHPDMSLNTRNAVYSRTAFREVSVEKTLDSNP